MAGHIIDRRVMARFYRLRLAALRAGLVAVRVRLPASRFFGGRRLPALTGRAAATAAPEKS